MNIDLSEALLETLASWGCEDILICPGARNSPLLMALDASDGFQIESFFDERSAGFYALGLARKKGRPVAVITTSGTAVSELLSASVEAFYSEVPLIWMTADRPRRFRGTAAPQSIEHLGIFSSYCERTSDIASLEDLQNLRQEFTAWSGQLPWHVNICFEEPLVDRPASNRKYSIAKIQNFSEKRESLENKFSSWSQEMAQNLSRPLVVVGGLRPEHRPLVLQWLKKTGACVYLETLSGLRGHPELEAWELKGSDRWLAMQAYQGKFRSLVRVGDIPTVRLWRDLEDKLKHLPVFSWSQAAWSGLSRPSHVFSMSSLPLDLGNCFFHQDPEYLSWQASLVKEGLQAFHQIQSLLEKYPLSEPGWVCRLSQVRGAQRLYLGNSLPIREWDLAAARNSEWSDCLGNRGANGIDGQVSTFLGWQSSEDHSLGFFGDLTAMYDLQALWSASPFRQGRALPRASICVMNNGGGQIFQRMFKKEIFLNQHQLHFQSWAEMFGWKYQALNQTAPLEWETGCIYEVNPSADETQSFWQEMDQYGY